MTRPASTVAFAPGATEIWFSPAASTAISATPVAAPAAVATCVTSTPSAASGGASLRPERVVADRADHRHTADIAERPRGRDGLVPALAALVLVEPAADRLAGGGEAVRRTPRGRR